MEDVVEKMRNDITVRVNDQNERDGSFFVSFSYMDAEGAMRVTAKLAQLFIDESLRDQDVATQGFSQFIDGQAEDMRVRLADYESKLKGIGCQAATPTASAGPCDRNTEVLQESYKTLFRNILTSEMQVCLSKPVRSVSNSDSLNPARLPEHPIGPLLYPFLIVGAVGGIALRLLLRLVSSLWRKRGVRGTPVPA